MTHYAASKGRRDSRSGKALRAPSVRRARPSPSTTLPRQSSKRPWWCSSGPAGAGGVERGDGPRGCPSARNGHRRRQSPPPACTGLRGGLLCHGPRTCEPSTAESFVGWLTACPARRPATAAGRQASLRSWLRVTDIRQALSRERTRNIAGAVVVRGAGRRHSFKPVVGAGCPSRGSAIPGVSHHRKSALWLHLRCLPRKGLVVT